MFDSKGVATGIVEAAMDISDLRKAEHALAESERKFEDLFNDIPDAVFITKIGDHTGQIIVEIQKNKNISLVLMDISMPVLNGYDATRRIKELFPEMPVIAVTAYAMVGDKTKAEEAGCDDYITNPFNNHIFYETLEKYLRQ